jgi:hypothetical protein
LKFVIKTKQDEVDKKSDDVAKKQEIAMLEDLLNEKHNEGLKKLTHEEIKAKLDKLKAS